MFSDDDLLPISALQHLRFCERQWGLIHLEQQWEENRLTAEGRLLHDRVHESSTEARPNLIVARGLHLHCLRLGLTGQADAVEFHRARTEGEGGAVALPRRQGTWLPFPVEYKRGRPKAEPFDEIQLCAQALCLEEMFGLSLNAGALFYGKTRRRVDVQFDVALKAETEGLCGRMHELYAAGVTPLAQYAKKCERCSLMARCLPRSPSGEGAVERYLKSAWRIREIGK
jgi:CRISPR-associated exonuclease Cas4